MTTAAPLLSRPLPDSSGAAAAAYIHVPFCAHRCGYCDFTVIAGRNQLVPEYLRALEIELQSLEFPRSIETLFLGGGTPTHLAPDELERLLVLLRRWFVPVSDTEFSVEANPFGFTAEKIDVLADHGVNRVSLGAQSFDAEVLRTLERDHSGTDVEHVVGALAQRIDNIAIDLIFGVPGQSLDLWRETLRRAVALGPLHISTYGLTIEKGTAFWSRRRTGQLVTLTDETERAMYAAAMDDLAAAGFEQYELSNFSRPGRACRHNHTYWAGRSYWGFGPGAARYIRGRRETNHRSVVTWLKRIVSGQSPVADSEELPPEDRAREMIVLGLRRNAGVNRSEFHCASGFDLHELAGPTIAKYTRSGLLEDTSDAIRLTREGRFLADTVLVDFL
jgi:oxygen-independent coproporphyrinogen III oxidase